MAFDTSLRMLPVESVEPSLLDTADLQMRPHLAALQGILLARAVLVVLALLQRKEWKLRQVAFLLSAFCEPIVAVLDSV